MKTRNWRSPIGVMPNVRHSLFITLYTLFPGVPEGLPSMFAVPAPCACNALLDDAMKLATHGVSILRILDLNSHSALQIVGKMAGFVAVASQIMSNARDDDLR